MSSQPLVGSASAAPSHIPSLDGIRAISFLLVFVAHSGFESVVPGGLGVTVFFFLSGFLITTLMRSEVDRTGRLHLKHFWLRRCLRILPAFYLILALCYAMTAILGTFTPANTLALLAQSLHITNYWVISHGYAGFPEFSGTGVYWSLAVEEHFYLVFPFLYIALRHFGLSSRQQALTLGGLCALTLAWRCALVFGAAAPVVRTYMATDTRLDSILFGCLLAVYGNPVLDRAHTSERLWAYVLVPLALATMLASLLIRGEAFRETLRYTLQGLALIPLFSAAIRFPHWRIFHWLNSRPMALIGSLSYSLYLVHLGIIFTVRDALGIKSVLPAGLLSFALAFILAWTIYRLVERPCARLRRRLMD